MAKSIRLGYPKGLCCSIRQDDRRAIICVFLEVHKIVGYLHTAVECVHAVQILHRGGNLESSGQHVLAVDLPMLQPLTEVTVKFVHDHEIDAILAAKPAYLKSIRMVQGLKDDGFTAQQQLRLCHLTLRGDGHLDSQHLTRSFSLACPDSSEASIAQTSSEGVLVGELSMAVGFTGFPGRHLLAPEVRNSKLLQIPQN